MTRNDRPMRLTNAGDQADIVMYVRRRRGGGRAGLSGGHAVCPDQPTTASRQPAKPETATTHIAPGRSAGRPGFGGNGPDSTHPALARARQLAGPSGTNP